MKAPQLNAVRGKKGTGVRVLSVMLFVALSLLGFAAPFSSSAAAPANPKLASMQIEIWPEFDRPATLVILKGEFAEDVAGREVSLRIPAASGGPIAAAFSAAPGGELFNLAYDKTDSKDFITLRFKPPQKFFQIEFYDPLSTTVPDRGYTYTWPGDMAVGKMSVNLQEPASATNISMQPPPGAAVSGPHGLLYRTAEIGAVEAGKSVPVAIRYTKTDSRTSVQILGLKTPNSESSAADASPAPSVDSGGPAADQAPIWLLVLTFAAVLVVAATLALLWWLWRNKTPRARAGHAAFCTRCGGGIEEGDRFCSACGSPVQPRRHARQEPAKR